jgi:hypothetical protein
MGVSNNGVVVIVIIAAGFTLIVGISITRFFSSDRSADPSAFREPSVEQATYMRSVRERNQEAIRKDAGRAAWRSYSPRREDVGGQGHGGTVHVEREGQRWEEYQEGYYMSEGETTPRA